ncbi:predicted protein [Naegleria gruberi]|uniref:Predicted protein n=1 Tax=Naegleria gruberi TaxID=5762 RepID=D2V1W0_NAEGR|nr:uncharacterized protein NAEGRDRAFT_62715 [Naegleria gruberi]EFC49379.1 predicted protein [Naegleria gruberi]|eukprot:XP_002682123.1 predicted protein [Naegleria gruberi strain NEG-M]
MSKRTYEEYSYEDDHLCEPDFSLQAFLPHHQTIFYDSDHVHLNYYESSLKKKRFDPPSQSLFSFNNNTSHNVTTITTNTPTTIQPSPHHQHHHHHDTPFYHQTHHQQPSSSLYIQSTIGFDLSINQHSNNNNMHQDNSIMEDDQILSPSSSSNIHDSYIYRKHLQHVEYLRATVINQELNRKNSIINFQVKGLSGQTISFSQVDIESSTLFDLQQIINEQLGIPIPKQRIVLKGRIIPTQSNVNTLRLCEIIGIENNCIFQIVCALKGG